MDRVDLDNIDGQTPKDKYYFTQATKGVCVILNFRTEVLYKVITNCTLVASLCNLNSLVYNSILFAHRI